eukprot:TRINITY_DN1811_c0_g1_i1.p2 TRINITY_DN1811_c0_g1~~TRINITY_DN1811_c0_g1_i1.p2  ORF type:complete len:223 (+),score=-6.57 TRINITY_DN1811_c0_g1_i1:354-1022(+)
MQKQESLLTKRRNVIQRLCINYLFKFETFCVYFLFILVQLQQFNFFIRHVIQSNQNSKTSDILSMCRGIFSHPTNFKKATQKIYSCLILNIIKKTDYKNIFQTKILFISQRQTLSKKFLPYNFQKNLDFKNIKSQKNKKPKKKHKQRKFFQQVIILETIENKAAQFFHSLLSFMHNLNQQTRILSLFLHFQQLKSRKYQKLKPKIQNHQNILFYTYLLSRCY